MGNAQFQMPWFRDFVGFRALGISRLKRIWGEAMIDIEWGGDGRLPQPVVA